MFELMHRKKDRNHSGNTVYLLICNEMSVRLAVPQIPWNTGEFRLTAVAGCVREQKEGRRRAQLTEGGTHCSFVWRACSF